MAGAALLKHTWKTSISNDTGGAALAGDPLIILGSNEFNESISIAAGQTAEIDCGSLAFGKMVSLFLVATGAVEVDTNALGGAGGQVINLAANKAYSWNNTMPTSNPVTANITKIFVINSGIVTVTFKAGILLDLLV